MVWMLKITDGYKICNFNTALASKV